MLLPFEPVVATHWGHGATFLPGENWNGWKIYLSPAHHYQGDKFGCNGYIEDREMRTIAFDAADHTANHLAGRGYQVRIGDGFPRENVTDANQWGADRYIAMHSNATTTDGTLCAGTVGGTQAYYYSTLSPGYELAAHLVDKLGPESPGTSDSIRQEDLEELRDTAMPAAYLEAAFHDFGPDQEWLVTRGGQLAPTAQHMVVAGGTTVCCARTFAECVRGVRTAHRTGRG